MGDKPENQTTLQAAEAAAATAAAAAEAARTRIVIQGQEFDLADMRGREAIARAQALRALLPPAYQERAEKIAEVLRNYQSVEQLGLPPDLPFADAWKQFAKRLKETNGQITGNDPQWMQKLAASALGQQVIGNGLYRTARGIEDLASGGMELVGGAVDGALLGPRLMLAAMASGNEIFKANVGGYTPEQIDAIATAIASGMYMQIETPDSPAETRRRDPNLGDKAVAGIEKGMSMLMHLLPEPISAWIMGVVQWARSGFKGGFDAIDTHKAEAAARLQREKASGGAPSFAQILDDNITSQIEPRARAHALEVLGEVENIAGVATAPLAQLLQQGGVYRAKDGLWHSFRFRGNEMVDEVVKDENGKPITAGDRINNEFDRADGRLTDGFRGREVPSAAYIVGGVAGAAVGGKVLINTARVAGPAIASAGGGFFGALRAGSGSVVRTGVAAVAGTVTGALDGAASLGGSADPALRAATTRLAALEARSLTVATDLAAAQARLDGLKASNPKFLSAEWRQLMGARNEVGKLTQEATKVKDALEGTKGMFARPGARAAVTALEEAAQHPNAAARVVPNRVAGVAARAETLGDKAMNGVSRFFGLSSRPVAGTVVGRVVGTTARVGSRVVTPALIVWKGAEVYHGVATGNEREAVVHGTGLATILAGGVAGAVVGAQGGAVVGGVAGAGVGAIPGSILGGIGGFLTGAGIAAWGSLVTEPAAGAIYDRLHPPAAAPAATAPRPTGARPVDPGLEVAGVEATERARAAADAQRAPGLRLSFQPAPRVEIGALRADDTASGMRAAQTAPARPVHA